MGFCFEYELNWVIFGFLLEFFEWNVIDLEFLDIVVSFYFEGKLFEGLCVDDNDEMYILNDFIDSFFNDGKGLEY